MPPILTLLRPHQWIKNAFVVAPLFFTPQAVSAAALVHVALGVACFSAMSSAIYVLNDWCDREVDRKHPVKRLRPLAAGTVAQGTALALGYRLEVGAVSVVSGHIRGQTVTLPLHVEVLYNGYDSVGAFAAASLLASLGLVTLVFKTALEWRHAGDLASARER